MTSLKCMSYLADHDICIRSVPLAWTML